MRAFVLSHDCSGEELVEGVGVIPVVVLKAGFDNVGCRVLFAVVMMLSKNRSFHEAPEALNCVGVYKPLCVGYGVIDGEVRHPFIHAVVARVFVRYEHAIIGVYHVRQKRFQCLSSDLIGRLGNDLAAACECSNDGLLFCSSAALGRVVIVMLSTSSCHDKGFIRLDNAAQEYAIISHPLANLHTHAPSSGRGKVEVTSKLQTGDAFLGVQKYRNAQKPFCNGTRVPLKIVPVRTL